MTAKIRFLAKMVDMGRIAEEALPEKYKAGVIEYRRQQAEEQNNEDNGGQTS